ncbi:hypothetical protein BKP37_16710 [Anaerobacillus alkalilacustris]|uniref:Type II secretion system protein GspF domain-containing protein n=1 Tax=Anaerobacillus alkalilacustris TaxID=393763 RepID=A0A1S2LF87_9BACI|nr:type II secretion system F family protein [Anaerobacillus alkalilacustris]OIJ11051.1 hypothetical protein BKP37_16710 [Anaerobacillus alkalilacustris]
MFIFIFILSTLSFALTTIYYRNKKQKVQKRINRFIPRSSKVSQEKEVEVPSVKPTVFKEFITTIAKNIKASETKQNKWKIELESADIPLKVEEFMTIRIVLFSIMFIALILSGVNVLLSIVIGLISWKLPTIYVKKKKEARVSDAATLLPQTLETMASAMKSGFSFLQAMQLVSREVPAPIGIEFERTIKEINFGIPTETAFANLLKRLPNKDLEIAVTAVVIQRSTGGNLAAILETIHETISERVRMKDELKALTSQGRMSALVITLLPIILGLLLNVMNPEYFSPMFSHPLGWLLLAGGTISGILGWIFIQKVVTIEV